MMKFGHLDLLFPQEYLKATLMISLLTVWVLVGLFYYLNRYTKRDYFAIWTAGWLFYALWLTTCLNVSASPPGGLIFMAKQCCVSLSAVFLLWGSLRFLGLPVRQSLFGMFMLFLVVWTAISPQVITDSLQIQLPIFILLGGSSLFAGVCFYRLRRHKAFVGAGMLSLGFLLWGLYLGTYPLSLEYGNLYSAGFFVSAVLQLFIAVSMIVLVLEEVRENMVQKERLHAIGKMAIGMAHDVNNALSPIIGYSELLRTTLPNLDEQSRADLAKISEAAEKVARIVTRMRDVYRREVEPNPARKPDSSEFNLPVESTLTGRVEIKMSPEEKKLAETVAQYAVEEEEGPALARDWRQCRALRILYIDDEPLLRQLLSDILQLNNHEVTVAASGKEGLEVFRTRAKTAKPYEVVITDFGMPEMDGRQVARTLRAEFPGTPILMLTGWGAMLKEDGQTIPEVNAVIAKPPHLRELNNLLAEVCARNN
jgi:CheY-like chemotaxis protein